MEKFSRINRFVYRGRRRILRELRKRGNGIDVSIDTWLYHRFQGRTDTRNRILQWAALAPWGEDFHNDFSLTNRIAPDETAALLVAAERACKHEFDLLGSGPVWLGDRIDWHVDFKSGHRWDSATHHARIKWIDLPPGVDIKVPWELSRCMHFATLGLADWITGDIRYYDEWKAQVLDWIESNPVGRGVNWVCPMDVAMRAVNWLNAAMLFRQRIQNDMDGGFFNCLCESLWHHGLDIARRLEWGGPHGGLPGNHFLADLTGLLAIGAFFTGTRRGDMWWDFAHSRLQSEMNRQVHPDGCNYESSTSYHRMVMEMFLWADSLAERRQKPFSTGFRQRLGMMAEFVSCYSGPNGKAAQIGDNDSGRLLWAGLDDGRDHRYLTPDECGFGGSLNRFLLRGTLPMPGRTRGGNAAFPDGGFYFLRNESAWLALRAGTFPHGGGHAHCDQLSTVLSIAGEEILVDRGTGIYTPDVEKRNCFRSTAAHNTLMINGLEQCRISLARNQVFRMPDDTRAYVSRWEPQQSIWEAGHKGFAREAPGMCCSRRVSLECKSIEILDLIEGLRDGDKVEWFFHFAPGIEVRLDDHQVRVESTGQPLLEWDFRAMASVLPANHSPAYGVESPARCLCLSLQAKMPQPLERFRIEIRWS